MVIWLEHPLTNAWILLPWLFLLTRSVAERARPGPVLGLSALLGALFVAGHPESEAFVVAGLVAYLAFELAAGRHDGRLERGDVPRRAAWWALALGGGALLSAVMTVPVLELFHHSAPDPRGGLGAAVQRPRQLGLPRGLRPPGQGLLRSRALRQLRREDRLLRGAADATRPGGAVVAAAAATGLLRRLRRGRSRDRHAHAAERPLSGTSRVGTTSR